MASNVIPFTAAAHRYREKIYTTTWTPTTTTADISPTGGVIKSYGYLRALRFYVSNKTAGAGGNAATDFPFNLFSNVQVTQPNGEEMFGGPTWTGAHTYLAALNNAWKLNNDPTTMPSYSATSATPSFILPVVFETNAHQGIGSLPNQDFSAPWKLQLVANTLANVWTTAPTTTPVQQLDLFMDCWTVPSPQNPLNPSIGQQVAPPLLGTLNKWTVQQYQVTASSQFNVLLQRKGNAIRNLVFRTLNSSSAPVSATANFPDPFSFRWDGTVIRSNDSPVLVREDEFQVKGGEAAATPVTAPTGVIAMKMSDPNGIDAGGSSDSLSDPFGMNAFWGTVQSSTLEVDGTWGSSAALLQVLTNDVQFVNLAGNPYAFAYSGYLQAPAQPSART